MSASIVNTMLTNTSLDEVLQLKNANAPSELITVNTGSSVHDALKAMMDKKISALPVLDVSLKVVGIIDMMDIMRVLMQEIEGVDRSGSDLNFSELLRATTIADIMDFAHGDPLLMSNSRSSLESIMKFFASGLSHHCVVFFDQEKTYGILSQLDIAHWFATNLSENSALSDALSEVPLISELKNRSAADHEVVKVLETDSVESIIKVMLRENVRGVAIVDKQGKLQGNFSVADLTFIDEMGSVTGFQLSVHDYLHKYSKWPMTPLAILENEKSTLAESMVMFAGLGIHRIWLVDSPVHSKFSPVGVVTATDVLRILYNHFHA